MAHREPIRIVAAVRSTGKRSCTRPQRHCRRVAQLFGRWHPGCIARHDGRGGPLDQRGEADALPTDREPRHRRQHAQRRPGQPGRVGRLAVPAALRLAQRVWGAPRRRQGRALPDRPGRGRRTAPQAILLAGNQRPGHPLPAPRRHRRGRGLHAGRARGRAGRPARPPGAGGPRPAAAGGGVPPGVRLRPGAARHQGERARRPLRRPGPVPGVGRFGPPSARRRRGGGRVPPRRGPERHLRPADHRPGRPPRPLPRDRGGRGLVPRDGRLLAAVGGPLHLPGPLARGRPALGPGAEAAHLPADRGDRRRPDHQPAGGARRGAELGLPLHLDPRRRVHGVRLPARRLHRGGGPVHGLADRPLEGALVRQATGRCSSCTPWTAGPTWPSRS
jgi:hypothetical protein